MKLTDLSDAQLLESLKTVCGQGRVVLARLLAHLIEVEERRLHLEAACPSMFQFCVRRLGMSEDEACRRIHAARLARRFPDLLARIERGELTLSTIALLHDALTESSYEELVEAAAGKTKAEVQALLARRSPIARRAGGDHDHPDAAGPSPRLGALTPVPASRGGGRAAARAALGDAPQGAVHGERRAPQEARARTGSHAPRERGRRPRRRRRARRGSAPREAREAAARQDHAPATSREQEASSRACRARRGARSSSGTASAAPSPMPKAIAARRRPGSSSITSSHARAAARASSETCASAAVPTTASTPSRRSARSTSSARSASVGDPRQRGYASESCELAASGLVNMGFRRAEVRRALDAVSARHRSRGPDHHARPDHPPRGAGGPDVAGRCPCRSPCEAHLDGGALVHPAPISSDVGVHEPVGLRRIDTHAADPPELADLLPRAPSGRCPRQRQAARCGSRTRARASAGCATTRGAPSCAASR